MSLRRISAAVIVGTIVLVVGYDLVPAFVDPRPGDTISEVLRDWSVRGWVLPYLGGVLAGHFWLRVPWARANAAAWLLPAAAMALAGLLGVETSHPVAWAALLGAGALAGATWFPLSPPT